MLILTGQILVLLGRWAGKAGVRKTRMAYHTNQSVSVILHTNGRSPVNCRRQGILRGKKGRMRKVPKRAPNCRVNCRPPGGGPPRARALNSGPFLDLTSPPPPTGAAGARGSTFLTLSSQNCAGLGMMRTLGLVYSKSIANKRFFIWTGRIFSRYDLQRLES